MSDDDQVKARFRVTKTHVVITAQFKNATCQLVWRKDDEDAPAQIRALIATMPELIADGSREVLIQSEVDKIDAEYEALFPKEGETGE